MIKIILTLSLIMGSLAFAQQEVEIKPAYNESAIPLKLAEDKVQITEKSSSTKMTLGLLIVAVMLGTGIFLVKKFGNSKTNHTSLMQIKVIAQHYLGPKKSIAVIRVAGESLLIGITDNQINLIKGLSLLDEDLSSNSTSTADFPELENTEQDQDTERTASGIEEDFSFADLKSTVANKLKSTRGFQ